MNKYGQFLFFTKHSVHWWWWWWTVGGTKKAARFRQTNTHSRQTTMEINRRTDLGWCVHKVHSCVVLVILVWEIEREDVVDRQLICTCTHTHLYIQGGSQNGPLTQVCNIWRHICKKVSDTSKRIVFTALHGMQTSSSDENSVRLSVRP